MKCKMLLTAFIILALMSATVTAKEIQPPKEDNPFDMTVDLGVLMMKSTSTLDTNGKDTIEDNTKEGNSPSSVWAFPLFDLRYNLKQTQTQLFFGTPIDGSNIALSLGAIQPLPRVGIASLSIAPSLGVTLWKNPYLKDIARGKTPVKMMTTHFKLNRVAFKPLNLYYAHRSIHVEDDEIGNLLPDLRRNGTLHYFQASYDMGLSKTSILKPGLTLERGDYDGAAQSYHNSGVSVSYQKQAERLSFMFEAMVNQSRFEKEHPLYQKTREEYRVSLFALMRIESLFGRERLHSNIIAGGGRVDSNIDFFDSNDAYVAFTVGYAF